MIRKWAASLIIALLSFRLYGKSELRLFPLNFLLILRPMQGKDDRVDSSADSETPSTRTFLDIDGTRWRVYEQAFGDYDRRSGMSLIFASEAAVRRVRDFPRDWMQLSDEELLALSWMN